MDEDELRMYICMYMCMYVCMGESWSYYHGYWIKVD